MVVKGVLAKNCISIVKPGVKCSQDDALKITNFWGCKYLYMQIIMCLIACVFRQVKTFKVQQWVFLMLDIIDRLSNLHTIMGW